MMETAINTTPHTEIVSHPGTNQGIRLFLKRDDLLHPVVQGNKWRKLHLQLKALRADAVPGILSFGGPFSNHLHAVAAAGQNFGFKTAAILRGSALDPNNPTLQYLEAAGMACFPVPKKSYDLGILSPDIQAITQKFPAYFILPEGGSSTLGVAGCVSIGQEIIAAFPDDKPLHVCVPAGTGCTAAGTLAGLGGRGQLWVFPAAPYGVDAEKIREYCTAAGFSADTPVECVQDYLFDGFARFSPVLHAFTSRFKQETGILLDPIYTAKMMYGVFDLLEKGFFPDQSQVVAVHTGGLQGWDGFRYRFGAALTDL
jgi:1-aminocyclopropane-1-carboxylate deaminase/D-cysteine desulfhydrase-like pyridoxal-dependent ACC family enzyme